jgi:type II restriction enzyme
MATAKQQLGAFGEVKVASVCPCPRCKRNKTFKRLPTNFKCSDLICDFCGYLAQVKSMEVTDTNVVPSKILGAAWGPQSDRMQAAIYFSLYLVLVRADRAEYSIYFLPADLQVPSMFVPRKPLSVNARRAGWQGLYYDLASTKGLFVRIA